jgi:hypothetical protein
VPHSAPPTSALRADPVVATPPSFHRSTIVVHKVHSSANEDAAHCTSLADLLHSRLLRILYIP